MKKTNTLHTLWIMFMSAFYMVDTSVRAIFKRWFGNITRTWCDSEIKRWNKRMLKLLDIRYEIINPHQIEPQPGQATIVMVNHSSLFDIPLSFLAFPNHSLRMLAKKELGRIPFMGQAMKAADFPLIDRKNRLQAIKDLHAVHKLMETGIVLWIAPEGTRSKNGKVAQFKKGAFITAIQTQATIIPIGIRGANSILPARTFQFNLGQKATLHVGQPINAAEYTIEQKDVLLEKVRKSMLELVGE